MRTLMIRALPFLLYSELLLAHPGHGKPGFVHAHEFADLFADGALILYGLAVLCAVVYWMRRN
jgi:hypothetical protein